MYFFYSDTLSPGCKISRWRPVTTKSGIYSCLEFVFFVHLVDNLIFIYMSSRFSVHPNNLGHNVRWIFILFCQLTDLYVDLYRLSHLSHSQEK